jgi:predicted nuclease of predicted toxin-antitoxin system
MKILLDENLPHELRRFLMPMHEVFTVTFLGWSSFDNGELLAKAAGESFDVMITKDQGIEHQQNLTNLPLSVIVLQAKSNNIEDIRPLVPPLLAALGTLKPRTLTKIG